MAYWAKAKLEREQCMLFSPTLDALVAADHPVRLFDELLGQVDWSAWEARFDGTRGQPPIHPRVVAGVILYGLNRRIRSSRQLEDACHNRLDFLWLTEGRGLDHSTICGFRRSFRKELKGLFQQIGRMAMKVGMIELVEVAPDGTRVRANSGRHGTATAEKIEKRLAELDEQLERALDEMEQADAEDDDRHGPDGSGNHLPGELADLQTRQKKLREALEVAEEADTTRRKRLGKKAKPTQVPLSDPEAKVLPNKEGGFAPNYTPIVTTDGHRGLIVDAEVISDSAEDAVLVPALDRIEACFGQPPQRVMADGLYGTGHNLASLEARQIEMLTPVEATKPQPGDPAARANPRDPVAEDRWEDLPVARQTKKLHRSNFIYDEKADCYYCPMGEELPYESTKRVERSCGQVEYRVYRCGACQGCPLRGRCISAKGRGRTIQRDQHEKERERARQRMATEAGQERYKRRMWIGETPFAHMKAVMGVRQFLTRGRENVRAEWLWFCTAFNVGKLIREIGQRRRGHKAVTVVA